jgi:hypothetical protein
MKKLMFSQIGFLPAPGCKELTEELYRGDLLIYMNQGRFKEFIETRNLKFGRLSRYPDAWEGFTNVQIQRFKDVRSQLQGRNSIDKGFYKEQEVLDEIEAIQILAQNQSSNVFASCWSANQYENDLMWQYAKKEGCLVRVNAKLLIEGLKVQIRKMPSDEFSEVVYGHVEYHNFQSNEPVPTTTGMVFKYFKKDIAYNAEQEFRFVALSRADRTIENEDSTFSVSIPDIVPRMSFTCHPDATEVELKNIQLILTSNGLPDHNVEISKILRRRS